MRYKETEKRGDIDETQGLQDIRSDEDEIDEDEET